MRGHAFTVLIVGLLLTLLPHAIYGDVNDEGLLKKIFGSLSRSGNLGQVAYQT